MRAPLGSPHKRSEQGKYAGDGRGRQTIRTYAAEEVPGQDRRFSAADAKTESGRIAASTTETGRSSASSADSPLRSLPTRRPSPPRPPQSARGTGRCVAMAAARLPGWYPAAPAMSVTGNCANARCASPPGSTGPRRLSIVDGTQNGSVHSRLPWIARSRSPSPRSIGAH
jgi:hypothetical protein